MASRMDQDNNTIRQSMPELTPVSVHASTPVSVHALVPELVHAQSSRTTRNGTISACDTGETEATSACKQGGSGEPSGFGQGITDTDAISACENPIGDTGGASNQKNAINACEEGGKRDEAVILAKPDSGKAEELGEFAVISRDSSDTGGGIWHFCFGEEPQLPEEEKHKRRKTKDDNKEVCKNSLPENSQPIEFKSSESAYACDFESSTNSPVEALQAAATLSTPKRRRIHGKQPLAEPVATGDSSSGSSSSSSSSIRNAVKRARSGSEDEDDEEHFRQGRKRMGQRLGAHSMHGEFNELKPEFKGLTSASGENRSGNQGNEGSSSNGGAPGGLTVQQKRRIELNRQEAEQRKHRRKTSANSSPAFCEVRHDPFAEFVDSEPQEPFVDSEPQEPDADTIAHEPSASSEQEDNAEDDQGSRSNICKTNKHSIATERLRMVKANACDTWRAHLVNSQRVAQLAGTMPTIFEPAFEVPSQRFKIHLTHVTMAIRSIVYCRLCGAWAVKKSQNLQVACPRKPLNSDAAQKLRRMTKGLHPEAKLKEWPDGHDARVPTSPISVDWSG